MRLKLDTYIITNADIVPRPATTYRVRGKHCGAASTRFNFEKKRWTTGEMIRVWRLFKPVPAASRYLHCE